MTSQTLLAEWHHGPDCSCSRTSSGCSLRTAGTLWAESFTDWPAWATWDGGGLYGHPTPAPPTSGPECSSLLNTPTAADGKRTTVSRRARELFGATTLGEQVTALLPTPRAQLGEDRNNKPWLRPMDQPQNLENAVARVLLPTPTADQPGGTWQQHLARKQRMPDGAQRSSVTDLRMELDRALEHGEVRLLPTPTARLGDNRGAQAKRYLNAERSNDLDDAIAWLGDLTTPPSDAGSTSSDDPPPLLSTTEDG